VIRPDP